MCLGHLMNSQMKNKTIAILHRIILLIKKAPVLTMCLFVLTIYIPINNFFSHIEMFSCLRELSLFESGRFTQVLLYHLPPAIGPQSLSPPEQQDCSRSPMTQRSLQMVPFLSEIPPTWTSSLC